MISIRVCSLAFIALGFVFGGSNGLAQSDEMTVDSESTQDTLNKSELLSATDDLPATADPADSIVPDTAPEQVAESILEAADPADFEVRQKDEVWMISSRGVGSRQALSQSLSYQRRIDGDFWVNESFQSFIGHPLGGRRLRTVIYIHGNRTTKADALKDGLAVYDQTFVEWEESQPVRFVIWTWPSDRVGGEIKDVRTKASYAEQHAFHLARLLTHTNEQGPISIIGYSFGARLAINALHLIGGGSVVGGHLTLKGQSTPRVNLTLMAPAIRNDCFCNEKWMALKAIDHLFVLYNTQDRFLRLYKFARFDNKNEALGFTGIRSLRSGYLSPNQITQFNAASQVKEDHDYLAYIVDKRIERLVRNNLFEGSYLAPR